MDDVDRALSQCLFDVDLRLAKNEAARISSRRRRGWIMDEVVPLKATCESCVQAAKALWSTNSSVSKAGFELIVGGIKTAFVKNVHGSNLWPEETVSPDEGVYTFIRLVAPCASCD